MGLGFRVNYFKRVSAVCGNKSLLLRAAEYSTFRHVLSVDTTPNPRLYSVHAGVHIEAAVAVAITLTVAVAVEVVLAHRNSFFCRPYNFESCRIPNSSCLPAFS